MTKPLAKSIRLTIDEAFTARTAIKAKYTQLKQLTLDCIQDHIEVLFVEMMTEYKQTYVSISRKLGVNENITEDGT